MSASALCAPVPQVALEWLRSFLVLRSHHVPGLKISCCSLRLSSMAPHPVSSAQGAGTTKTAATAAYTVAAAEGCPLNPAIKTAQQLKPLFISAFPAGGFPRSILCLVDVIQPCVFLEPIENMKQSHLMPLTQGGLSPVKPRGAA